MYRYRLGQLVTATGCCSGAMAPQHICGFGLLIQIRRLRFAGHGACICRDHLSSANKFDGYAIARLRIWLTVSQRIGVFDFEADLTDIKEMTGLRDCEGFLRDERFAPYTRGMRRIAVIFMFFDTVANTGRGGGYRAQGRPLTNAR